MAQREPDGQLHHINLSLREGQTEVVTGWMTRFDEPLGTFTFAVELDGTSGRAGSSPRVPTPSAA